MSDKLGVAGVRVWRAIEQMGSTSAEVRMRGNDEFARATSGLNAREQGTVCMVALQVAAKKYHAGLLVRWRDRVNLAAYGAAVALLVRFLIVGAW